MTGIRNERRLELDVVNTVLTKHGIPSIKLEPPLGSNTGWPDRLFFMPGGKPFLLEFKAPGEEPTEKQHQMMDMLISLGYDVAWTDNKQDALQAIFERRYPRKTPKEYKSHVRSKIAAFTAARKRNAK